MSLKKPIDDKHNHNDNKKENALVIENCRENAKILKNKGNQQ